MKLFILKIVRILLEEKRRLMDFNVMKIKFLLSTTTAVFLFLISSNLALAGTPQEILTGLTEPASAPYGSTFLVTGMASLPVSITTTGGCTIPSNTVNNGTVKMTSGTVDCVVHYNQVGDETYDPAPEVTIIVTAQLASGQTAPDNSGNAVSNSSNPEVLITDPNNTSNITIASGTNNATLNVSNFISNGTGTLPAINVTSVDAGNTTVSMPISTTVTSSDSSWNGIITAPKITNVTIPDANGETNSVNAAIEVGLAGGKLSFNKGVRILIPGQADKRVGYVRPGISFTEITNFCSGDSQAVGDALSADSECKINVGSDMVIWTKHFTSFATFTRTVVLSGSGGAQPIISAPSSVATSTNNSTSEKIGETADASPKEEVKENKEETGKVLGVETFKFTKTLKKGSKGNEVSELQKYLLAAKFYAGKIDGIFGPATRLAVMNFQKANKILNGYGTVGPLTRALLNK